MAVTEAGARTVRSIESLYREHVGAVYRYAYAVLGNHADAEDVTQTTFVNALRAMERGEDPRKPENWLLTIAHNIVRQRWRQLQSRPAEVELEEGRLRHAAPAEDDETPAMTDVVRALQRIPTAQRSALVMRELEGRSYREIAEILGLTTGALETLLFRARKSLAEELENLVTCERAEIAISRHIDGRISRKERKRLQAHLAECPACARMARTQERYRGALKGLALLPLPASLMLFKGTSTASAAGLSTLGVAGGATAVPAAATGGAVGGGLATAGGGALLGGIGVKVAAVVAPAAVVGGAGYTGARELGRKDTPPPSPAATSPHRDPAGGADADRRAPGSAGAEHSGTLASEKETSIAPRAPKTRDASGEPSGTAAAPGASSSRAAADGGARGQGQASSPSRRGGAPPHAAPARPERGARDATPSGRVTRKAKTHGKAHAVTKAKVHAKAKAKAGTAGPPTRKPLRPAPPVDGSTGTPAGTASDAGPTLEPAPSDQAGLPQASEPVAQQSTEPSTSSSTASQPDTSPGTSSASNGHVRG